MYKTGWRLDICRREILSDLSGPVYSFHVFPDQVKFNIDK